MEYSEEEALKRIRESLAEKTGKKVPDDEILNVLDAMMDYYDEHGLNDISMDIEDVDDLDMDDLLKYVKKMIAKDKHSPLVPEDVEIIVRAEVEYEDSLLEDGDE